MRLIEADALRREVEAMINRPSNRYENDYEYGKNQALHYVADVLIDEAPTIVGWISCSERLPEPYKDVLACWRDIRKGCEDDYCMVTSWIEHGRWNSVADFVDMQVIAWMPLPKPYKEETDAF